MDPLASPSGRATAVVAGALANKVGNGGEAWVRPTWTVGLARLGLDAWFVEEVAPGPDGLADPAAVTWFSEVTSWFGLEGRSALVCGDRTAVGPPFERVAEVLADAALFVNISGHLDRDDLPTPAARRVYVDLDPGFTQVWAGAGTVSLAGHHHHVTVGTAAGTAGCTMPDNGLDWIGILPPVLMDRWIPTPVPTGPPRFTTVGSWRPPYGSVEHDGRTFGVKAHEFRRFLGLPAAVGDIELELALVIHDGDAADRSRLLASGFHLADPAAVAGTPSAFADHVRGSWGEWSVAQAAYVGMGTGWVSDRSAHYLAAGRPVVVQRTGATLPAGEGFLTFADPDDAADALARVAKEPEDHARAARKLAEQHLDSSVVLGGLLDRIGVAP